MSFEPIVYFDSNYSRKEVGSLSEIILDSAVFLELKTLAELTGSPLKTVTQELKQHPLDSFKDSGKTYFLVDQQVTDRLSALRNKAAIKTVPASPVDSKRVTEPRMLKPEITFSYIDNTGAVIFVTDPETIDSHHHDYLLFSGEVHVEGKILARAVSLPVNYLERKLKQGGLADQATDRITRGGITYYRSTPPLISALLASSRTSSRRTDSEIYCWSKSNAYDRSKSNTDDRSTGYSKQLVSVKKPKTPKSSDRSRAVTLDLNRQLELAKEQGDQTAITQLEAILYEPTDLELAADEPLPIQRVGIFKHRKKNHGGEIYLTADLETRLLTDDSAEGMRNLLSEQEVYIGYSTLIKVLQLNPNIRISNENILKIYFALEKVKTCRTNSQLFYLFSPEQLEKLERFLILKKKYPGNNHRSPRLSRGEALQLIEQRIQARKDYLPAEAKLAPEQILKTFEDLDIPPLQTTQNNINDELTYNSRAILKLIEIRLDLQFPDSADKVQSDIDLHQAFVQRSDRVRVPASDGHWLAEKLQKNPSEYFTLKEGVAVYTGNGTLPLTELLQIISGITAGKLTPSLDDLLWRMQVLMIEPVLAEHQRITQLHLLLPKIKEEDKSNPGRASDKAESEAESEVVLDVEQLNLLARGYLGTTLMSNRGVIINHRFCFKGKTKEGVSN